MQSEHCKFNCNIISMILIFHLFIFLRLILIIFCLLFIYCLQFIDSHKVILELFQQFDS